MQQLLLGRRNAIDWLKSPNQNEHPFYHLRDYRAGKGGFCEERKAGFTIGDLHAIIHNWIMCVKLIIVIAVHTFIERLFTRNVMRAI
jgi:hypothetical protein